MQRLCLHELMLMRNTYRFTCNDIRHMNYHFNRMYDKNIARSYLLTISAFCVKHGYVDNHHSYGNYDNNKNNNYHNNNKMH